MTYEIRHLEAESQGIDDTDGLHEAEALMVSLAVGTRLDRLGALVQEHLASGGRRMRARLALAAIEALGGRRLEGAPWAAACEVLHNAALIHDDIQDGDELRRGAAALWARHGTAKAINAGDLLLMLSTAAIEALHCDDRVRWQLVVAVRRRSEQAVRGQAHEIELRRGTPSWHEWTIAARGKSGALLALPVEGAALLCGLSAMTARELAAPFETLGVLYQAWDDILDLFGATGRARGNDLREGKPSALVAEHLRLHPADRLELMALLAEPRETLTEARVLGWVHRLVDDGALGAVLDRIAALEQAIAGHPTLSAVPDLAAIAQGIVFSSPPAIAGRWADVTPVVVVGSGFGGLAAAVRLRAMGHEVVVLEATDQHGGRASVFSRDGHVFDAGPTVITAPHLLAELFTLLGRDAADFYELLPVDPFYRVVFPDGEHFDYVGDEERLIEQIRRLSPRDVDGYRTLAAHCRDIFDIGYTGLADRPFHSATDMLRVAPSMARLRSDRTVLSEVRRHIRDERLRQVFSFQPLLVGGSPNRTSSIYLLIHWLERKWGVWFARGGTAALVRALVRLLEESGVELRTNAPVNEILVEGRRVVGVRLESGETVRASAVVGNGDPSAMYRLVPEHLRPSHKNRRIDRRTPSMSLFVAYFGTQRRYEDTAHHTILLGPRYEPLLDDIFVKRRLADDFSLYLHRSTATDPSLAPPGRDSFYALSPVPNLRSGTDWETEAPRYLDKLLRSLDRGALPGLSAQVVSPFSVDPRYFADRLRSVDGAAFGLEPTLRQSAYFRYHNQAEDLDGLYFVGQSTHPGGGVPGVLNSAKVLERVFPRPGAGLMNRHAKTFSAAARWLAPAHHRDVASVYAFCRTVDDRADESSDPAWLAAASASLRSGRSTDPIVADFLDVVKRRSLPVDAALALVDGVLGDLGRVRIEDQAELVRYGWAVAGTVGALMAALFGAPPEGRPFAIDLGIGMQLTNIARDVAEDAGRNRVYLPRTWLAEAGVDPETLVVGKADSAAVVGVVRRVVALAERYYESGESGLRHLPLRPRLAVALAASRYRAIGRAVVARGEAALADRTVLPLASRTAHALWSPIRALWLGLGAPALHDPRLHSPLGST